jgi:hypothetical protein
MNKEMYKMKHVIEDIITEHNDVWKDIGWFHRHQGYNCFKLKEDQIITIAAGLVNKGIK